MVKNATYTHLVVVKTSGFFVRTLPTFRVKISLKDLVVEKPLNLLKYLYSLEYIVFSISFRDEFLRFSSVKMINP